MIEREFIRERVKYLKVKEYMVASIPKSAGIGKINIEKTPLGEKIVVDLVKPGLIIGRGGKTIADLTTTLRTKFKMENPQIEVREIINPNLSSAVVANRIASDLERFGPGRFKAIGYRSLTAIMDAGALGAEIKIGGRGVPGSRAQSWRFPAGYMKKCGQIALEGVDIAIVPANLRTGTVGIQVRIMPPTINLPDRIKIRELAEVKSAESAREGKKAEAEAKVEAAAKKAAEEKKPKRPRTSQKKPSAEPNVPEKAEKSVETTTEEVKQ